MTHDYTITGMTCGKCVAKVKSALLKTAGILSAEISLPDKSARISMEEHVPTGRLQEAIAAEGNYAITMQGGDTAMNDRKTISPGSNGSTNDVHGSHFASANVPATDSYRPLQLIFGYLLLVTVLLQWKNGYNLMSAMQVFMGGFFLVFSFFKLMNLKGFAEGYGTYDIVAAAIPAWGFVYPFVELALGLAIITGIAPLAVNLVTLLVMGVSSIGVIRSLLRKQQVRCACLGTVISLPLGKVTLVEDLLMVLMSAIMIIMETSM